MIKGFFQSLDNHDAACVVIFTLCMMSLAYIWWARRGYGRWIGWERVPFKCVKQRASFVLVQDSRRDSVPEYYKYVDGDPHDYTRPNAWDMVSGGKAFWLHPESIVLVRAKDFTRPADSRRW